MYRQIVNESSSAALLELVHVFGAVVDCVRLSTFRQKRAFLRFVAAF